MVAGGKLVSSYCYIAVGCTRVCGMNLEMSVVAQKKVLIAYGLGSLWFMFNKNG
jgi:hypothetical protein